MQFLLESLETVRMQRQIDVAYLFQESLENSYKVRIRGEKKERKLA